jgi:hypothetical protein
MTEIISHCGTKIKTTTIKDHDVIQTKYEMVELFATNNSLHNVITSVQEAPLVVCQCQLFTLR